MECVLLLPSFYFALAHTAYVSWYFMLFSTNAEKEYFCMSRADSGIYRLHVNPPRSHLHMKFFQLFCSLFLSLLFFSNILGGWASPLPYAFAAGHPQPRGIPGSLTLRKFLQQGRPDHVYHGPFLR